MGSELKEKKEDPIMYDTTVQEMYCFYSQK